MTVGRGLRTWPGSEKRITLSISAAGPAPPCARQAAAAGKPRRRPIPADARSRTLDHRAAPSPQRRPGAGGGEGIAAAQRERLGGLALRWPHDWDDLTKGLAEAGRILAPAGVCSSIERLVPPGARGHPSHGLSARAARKHSRDSSSTPVSSTSAGSTRAPETGRSRSSTQPERRPDLIRHASSFTVKATSHPAQEVAGSSRLHPRIPATLGRKTLLTAESPRIPAQGGNAKTGLSRRRSRVRVPSLPSSKVSANRHLLLTVQALRMGSVAQSWPVVD
jgi:hypothetical protein